MKPSSRLVTLPVAGAALVSVLSLVLTGCGLGTTQAVTGATSAAKMSGVAHGGPNPIVSANVTLWETWTTGISGTSTGRTAASSSTYGSAAYQIGNTTTNSAGVWNIPSFNCDNGEYLYVTIVGGKTASNSPNPNSVLTAPVGACSALPSSAQVYVSEVSTIAMAYALDAFTSENPTYEGTGTQQVWIGAPAANNAASGSCTGTGATLACTASGLGQAFNTAISLVNSVSYVGNPTGNANTTLVDAYETMPNSSASVPQALINTLGNVLQSCVNTSGGTAGDSSGCGKLFTDTTSGTVTPQDTLEAAMNIALAPTVNVSQIYALAGPVSAFGPALTAQPNDFSLAVSFTGPNSATSFGNPQYVALKPTEDVVVLSTNSGATTDTLFDLAPSGALTASASQSTTTGESLLAVDLSGNIFAAKSATSGTVSEYDPSSLSGTHSYSVNTPGGIAVDRKNTVYFSQGSSSSASVYALTAGSFTPAQITISSSPAPTVVTGTSAPGALSIDGSQNLWLDLTGASNQQLNYVYQSSTCTPPDFCSVIGASITSATGSSHSTLFDNAAHVFTEIAGRVYKYGESENAIGFRLLASGDTFKSPSMDGAAVAFYPDFSAGTLYPFDTKTNTTAPLMPCSLRIAASTAQTTACVNALSTPTSTQVDASGAVWISDPGSKTIIKLLGIASPAWPSLALAKSAVKPN